MKCFIRTKWNILVTSALSIMGEYSTGGIGAGSFLRFKDACCVSTGSEEPDPKAPISNHKLTLIFQILRSQTRSQN